MAADDDEGGGPERRVKAEHRWPVAIALCVALALYALLPSGLFGWQRLIVVAICVVLLIPLIVINPRRYQRENRFSRIAETGLALLILVANQVTLVILIFQLVHKSNQGTSLLLASLQVWVTNVIAYALLYWCLDRGGPVARTTVPRPQLRYADFRFPQDEDHDAIDEVAKGSSAKSDWVPSFIDYLYFSLTNSMAFSPTDTMPLTARAKALMGLESFAAFVMLALVIARAVAQIG